MSNVTIRSTSSIDELTDILRQLSRNTINVGILGADSDLSMIAGVHEYGCDIPVTPKMRAWFAANGYPLKASTTVIHIPERSFLRSGFDENIDKITRKIKSFLPDLLESRVNPEEFMDMVGLEFAGMIQKKLKKLKEPPDSSMTIERKGSSNPLIDSGRLVGAIRHEVD